MSKGQPINKPRALFEEGFNKPLTLSVPKKGDTSFTALSFEYSDAQNASVWLNAFVNLAQQKTKEQLMKEFDDKLTKEIQWITEQIASKRAVAESRRLDRIARLLEALTLAESVGLKSPMINQSANNLNMEYMRGSMALKAEIDILQNRRTDDPFIEGIRDLQEDLNYLKAIKIDETKLRVVRVDQPSLTPESPIKPKKTLIVAVALVLGGMLGVFVALIRGAVRKRRGWVPEAI